MKIRDAAIDNRMVPVFEAVMALDVVLRHTRGITPNFLSFQTKLFPPQHSMLGMADGGEVRSAMHPGPDSLTEQTICYGPGQP